MKIFMVGGGTGGPNAVIVAVAEKLANHKLKPILFFVGSRGGLDKKFTEGSRLFSGHFSIPAGKWRRYFSFKNLFDFFKIIAGFFKSLYLIKKLRPDLVFGAGSFVQVPMAWAAHLLGVPVVIHQQDYLPGLSAKLTVALARAVTTAFPDTIKEFHSSSGLFQRVRPDKFLCTGNPVRADILKGNAETGRKKFALNNSCPTILVTGGGMGAVKLNEAILKALPVLLKYVQVLHITGQKKEKVPRFSHENYHQFDFLQTHDIKDAYAVSDLVISRGGMSAIAEISALRKPAILVPLPKSPQEINARILTIERCAVGVSEEYLKPELLVQIVRKIIWDKKVAETMRENLKKLMPLDAAQRIAEVISKVYNKT